MKKRNLLVALLVGAMVLSSLTGCGNTSKEADSPSVASTEKSDTEDVSEDVSGVTTEKETESGSETLGSSDTEVEDSISSEEAEVKGESLTEEGKVKESETENESDVKLGDYSGFTYTREYIAPTEEDLNSTISDILNSNITEEMKDSGTTKAGDTVIVSFTGSVDGEVLEGLSADEERITLGSEEFLKEFEDAIVGHEVGEDFEVSLEFPNDYSEVDVAGKTAVFDVVVNYIVEQSDAPELSDEWVKENSEYKTVKEYKEAMMKNLEAQANEYADSTAVYSLISDLYAVSSAVVSDEEISEKISSQLDMYKSNAEEQGISYEEYVKDMLSYADYESDEEYVKVFEDSIKESVKDEAEKKKILDAFANAEDVDLSDDAYNKYLESEAEMYGYDSKEEFESELESVGYLDGIRVIFEEMQVGKKLMEISEEVKVTEAMPDTETESVTDTEEITEAESDKSTEVTTEAVTESEEEVVLGESEEIDINEVVE